MAIKRRKRKKLGRLTGGTEVPLSSKDSLLIGRKHEQGGIKDKAKGVELEDNETVSTLSNGQLFVGSDTVKNPDTGRTFAEDFKDIGQMARRKIPGANRMRDQLAMKQEMVKGGGIPKLKKYQNGGILEEYGSLENMAKQSPTRYARFMTKLNRDTGGDRAKITETLKGMGIQYSDYNKASHIFNPSGKAGSIDTGFGRIGFSGHGGTDFGNTTLAQANVPHAHGVFQGRSLANVRSFDETTDGPLGPIQEIPSIGGSIPTPDIPSSIPNIGEPTPGIPNIPNIPGDDGPGGIPVAPFLDNIAALALQDNRPAPITRQQSYLSPALRTNTEELRQIGEQSRNLTRLAQRQNINQGALNASLGSLQAARSKAVTASETAKDQFNIPVINRFRQANANIEAANIGRQLQDETRAFQLGSDRRAQFQQNVADVGKDIQGIQRDQEARDLDEFQLQILARQYGINPNQIPRRRRRRRGLIPRIV